MPTPSSSRPAPTFLSTKTPTVAFVGLGAMGARMAGWLLQAGTKLVVYNRSPAPAVALQAKGAVVADSPQQAARDADVLISMVTDDDVARSLLLDEKHGALGALKPGAILVESSTVTPRFIAELDRAAADQGVHLLDAPVAGSRPQAEAGQLIYLVGGPDDILDAVRPLLLHMGGAIHHAGPSGAGAKIKLVVNGLFAAQVAALAESLAFARTVGLDPTTTMDILGALPTTSAGVKGAGGLMLAEKDAPLFPIALVEKDLRYFVGDRSEAQAPIATSTWNVFQRAAEAGHVDDNLTAVRKLYV